MNIPSGTSRNSPRPPFWALAAAFSVLYAGYGFNFLAVRVGVENLPPFLFAGSHVGLAGIILLVWHLLRSRAAAFNGALSGTFVRAAVPSFFLFVGGVGMVTLGEKLGVPSGIAAIIKASAPLWVAIIETVRPHGEKANAWIFLGLALGAGGVALMILPDLNTSSTQSSTAGLLLLALSALLFAVGTIVVRHRPPSASIVESIACQMVLGGTYLLAIGTLTGEPSRLDASALTPPTIAAFLFLLFVHSLAAFSALNWLLAHLPAAIVTTKFYVSPVIAVLAGWLILDEAISAREVVSMLLILSGVAVILFLGGSSSQAAARPADSDEIEA